MLIDGFTIVAQIVNFLILAAVLKFVLYDRIIDAMDRREQGIADRISEAEERERTAEREADAYRTKREDLDRDRDRVLDEAREEADAERRRLLDEARGEVDEQRRRWEAGLASERRRLMEELQRRTGEQVCAISRRALADLADADLEAQIVDVALERIPERSEELARISEEVGSETAASVSSSFTLDDDRRSRITKALAEHLDLHDVDFGRDPELICGLEIRAGGWRIGWSVDAYLDHLSDEIGELLPTEAGTDD